LSVRFQVDTTVAAPGAVFRLCFFFVVTITGRVFAGAAPCAPALLLFLFVLFSRCASAYRVVRRERERERERGIENERQEER